MYSAVILMGTMVHRHPLDPLYERLAEMFQALANPGRLHIVRCVSEREKSVSEILACKAFDGVPQSTVSQHLAALRQQGLLKARRSGRNVYYSLSDPAVAQSLAIMGDLIEKRFAQVRDISKTL